ncbi:peptidoglycan-binding protein [Aliishimia ponticola]|uniref:Peptidoglycan-binding protein n=1 Tax=Aliishimia ponticola TaxID=2499833 RepID=A0A4S4NGU5_9RHOB|nr:peptidoglycan-binding domain-containing protein [Aliishimia ponticola]THH37381.1 peptidoglycan-binding protein [Aliishimia ponticola]
MRTIASLLAVLAIAGCTPGDAPATRETTQKLFTPSGAAPQDAAPGTCWDKTETPARVRSVTEDVLVQPAQMSSEGTVQAPPIYRSQTHIIVEEDRHIDWVQIACTTDLTPEFVASVQRALALRNLYDGPDTGVYDDATRAAVARFQTEAGIKTIDPGNLTIDGARKLGLWAVAQPAKPA